MKLITTRSRIRDVAVRWRAQYPLGCGNTNSGDPEIVYQKLLALDLENATAGEVNAIIGNESWTHVGFCRECKRDAPTLVQCGDENDWDSRTTEICFQCARKVVALFGVGK